MSRGRVIMLGMARPGFDTELALHMFHESVVVVEKLGSDIMRPDGLVTDPEESGQLAFNPTVTGDQR